MALTSSYGSDTSSDALFRSFNFCFVRVNPVGPGALGRMGMRKRLRVAMWLSAIVAIISQLSVLVELHGPEARDDMLWFLMSISVASCGVFLYTRARLASIRKRKRYQRPAKSPSSDI
jgi:hypothetical protein